MGTNAKCGFDGTTSIGTEVTAWELNLLEDTPDATSMDSNGFREYLACLKSAEGTFDSQVPCGIPGARVGVSFSNDVETITFDLIVSNVAITTPVEGKVTYKYTFVSTGPVVIS